MTQPINLYSDTQTQPTAAMRRAMAEASVGDEQSGSDPTVNRLCHRIAELLGKEAAVFLPSGTMCNEIALAVHCRPGDEVLTDHTAHIIHFEGGGPAALAGATVQPLMGQRGVFSAEQLAKAIRPVSRYAPRTKLVSVEQTANLGGGTVWPLETLQAIKTTARDHSLAVHMDGARLFNATVAARVEPAAFAACADSVWVDLTKGLGCPFGAVLAGSGEFIDQVWWWKQRLGGAMRQAGIMAAAGLYALDHHIERLADDHQNARRLAAGLVALPHLRMELDAVATNMVFFEVTGGPMDAHALSAALEGEGVLIGAMDKTRLRAVTHLDIREADVDAAAAAVARLGERRA